MLLYDRGMSCNWMGREVKDMNREELIAFIGQLDMVIERLGREIAEGKKGVDDGQGMVGGG